MNERTDGGLKFLLGGLSVLIVLYSLIIVQQILLGVLAAGTLWFVYLLWRFLHVLDRIAAALEVIARERTE